MEEAEWGLLEESFRKAWPTHYRSVSLQYLLRGFPILQGRLSLIHFSHTDLPSNSSLTIAKTHSKISHWHKPVLSIVLRKMQFPQVVAPLVSQEQAISKIHFQFFSTNTSSIS